jgi:hypothetical protein
MFLLEEKYVWFWLMNFIMLPSKTLLLISMNA